MSLIYKPFIGIALNAVILFALVQILPEITYTGGLKFFIIGGFVLGMINFLVKPFMKMVSIPLTIMTGGLFIIVINIVVLYLLKYVLDLWQFRDVALSFPNWYTYVVAAIVFGIINFVTHIIIK